MLHNTKTSFFPVNFFQVATSPSCYKYGGEKKAIAKLLVPFQFKVLYMTTTDPQSQPATVTLLPYCPILAEVIPSAPIQQHAGTQALLSKGHSFSCAHFSTAR